MVDQLDRAQELAELERTAALSRHAGRPRPPGRSHCVDCGEEIPASRRAAVPGCYACAFCQANREDRS